MKENQGWVKFFENKYGWALGRESLEGIKDFIQQEINKAVLEALQKRDEEWQELIPILKKQGAWDKTNEQILENLEKIGKKDFAKLLTLTN